MSRWHKLTRRSFLALTGVAPGMAWGAINEPQAHHFWFDGVIGTSLDLVVWTPSAAVADRASDAALDEIHRLTGILNTRDPASEIRRLEDSRPGAIGISRDLAAVLSAYARWTERTGGALSIRPEGPQTQRNVDALGKAYIIERAADAGSTIEGVDGLLLNIGGDIVVRGRACEIAVTHPSAPQDNATPLTWLRLRNAAVATSGTYARGAHLIDARSGRRAMTAASATVVAPDAVTANALATTLCVMSEREGMALVEDVSGAEALRVGDDGAIIRTSGFRLWEQPRFVPSAARADWPAGYALNITLTLTNGAPPRGRGGRGPAPGGRGGGAGKRQYVAVWIEDTAGKLVRVLAFWADKDRYYAELSSFYSIAGGARGRGNVAARGAIPIGRGFPGGQSPLAALARATRSPGKYQLVWDGLDESNKPAPAGTYRVVVETSQEHGVYAKQAGTIECADKPSEMALSATSNFEVVTIHYGPVPRQA